MATCLEFRRVLFRSSVDGTRGRYAARRLLAGCTQTSRVDDNLRSEERRVGKEGRSRWAPYLSSRRRHTLWPRAWSSDVCSSDLRLTALAAAMLLAGCSPAARRLRASTTT